MLGPRRRTAHDHPEPHAPSTPSLDRDAHRRPATPLPGLCFPGGPPAAVVGPGGTPLPQCTRTGRRLPARPKPCLTDASHRRSAARPHLADPRRPASSGDLHAGGAAHGARPGGVLPSGSARALPLSGAGGGAGAACGAGLDDSGSGPAGQVADRAARAAARRSRHGPRMGTARPGRQRGGVHPFGRRGGAEWVQETAIAVPGLAADGQEKEASGLYWAGCCRRRRPSDTGCPRRSRVSPAPKGVRRCRIQWPAVAPPGGRPGGLLLTALAGIRPDAPAGTLTSCPDRSAPLGEIVLTGLRLAGAPFSVRVGRLRVAVPGRRPNGCNWGVTLGDVSGPQTVATDGMPAEQKRISCGSGPRRECLSSGRRL